MAFRPASKPPQFADLKGILSQSKETDNPLYQVVQEIIERLTQLDLVKGDQIKNIEKKIETFTTIITPPAGEELPAHHAITHQPGGTDPMAVDAVPATGSLRTLGTGANQAAAGNDLRFTDARAPLPHGTTHNSGGSDPITAIAETIITDGALLARNAANETITGQWLIQNPVITQEGANPGYILRDTSAGTDGKIWRLIVIAGTFFVQTVNDAINTAANAYAIMRSGNVVTSHSFYTNAVLRTSLNSVGLLTHINGLALSGQVSVSLSGDQTAWNFTGLGSSFFVSVTPTVGGWIIRGILAQAPGTIVAFYNASSSTYQFNTEDAAASAANRITMANGANVICAAFTVFVFYYDGAVSRWRCIARS